MSADATRTRIETLLGDHPIVLFMKGTRNSPQCGFSASTVGALNDLLPNYHTVNVLEDPDIREGIKAYGNWPTIPQLYVNRELVGGADIVRSMYTSGELHALLGLPAPDRTPPSITITDKAATAIREALAEADPELGIQLSIDAQFNPQFQLSPKDDRAVMSESNGITVYMDPASAQRARGIRIDWVETPRGAGLAIDNPNAPSPIQAMRVQELKLRLDAGDITLVDVRPPDERAHAALSYPFQTLDAGPDALTSLPKNTPLAFICHTGSRSQRAAEHFRALGFAQVFNVDGGIDAWSREIDTAVPRY
ncbi:MAG: Grx4 family monothiol glutaredoxin [Rudaea sp.]